MSAKILTAGGRPRELVLRRGDEGYCVLAAARAWSSKRREQAAALLCGEPAKLPQRGTFVIERHGPHAAWARNVQQLLERCGLDGIDVVRLRHWPSGTAAPACDPLLEQSLKPAACRKWLDSLQLRGHRSSKRGLQAQTQEQITTVLRERLGMPVPDFVTAHIAKLSERLQRPLAAAELAVLAQLNAEHSRHHTFRAAWSDGDARSLLERLRQTWKQNPAGVPVAYTDNAAVLAVAHAATHGLARSGDRWQRLPNKGRLQHATVKTETHNHPTAIAPFEGSATGVGGEIRDGMATGRGAAAGAGGAGLLLGPLPAAPSAADLDRTGALASPLAILLDAPLGWAAFGNEFGRPAISGFMRPSTQPHADGGEWSFRKPVMLAGGVGRIAAADMRKRRPQPGDLIMQLGGPGSGVGLGGGTAASQPLGSAEARLERSVQRACAEMQRRCQEVIEACARGANPIQAIHDIGAGGIANAAAELCAPHGCELHLPSMPMAEAGCDAATVLCNEAQERFLLLVRPRDQQRLAAIAAAERCPLHAIGRVTDSGSFRVTGSARRTLVDLPVAQLYAEPPSLAVAAPSRPALVTQQRMGAIDLTAACHRILRHPAVGDKSYLATICDRGVGGLVARDQFIGPRQLAVADAAATMTNHHALDGCAFAWGERPAIASIDPAAAARISVAEALTNLACYPIGELTNVKLSLNWLADASEDNNLADLRAAVAALVDDFLPRLELAVVMGKDSLAMRADLPQAHGGTSRAPSCCVAGAWAGVANATAAIAPLLSGRRDSLLLHIAATPTQVLGGSVATEVLDLQETAVPDADADGLRAWWLAIQALHREGLLLSYHDVSDGGLLTTVIEMCLASGCGAELNLDSACASWLETDGWDSLGAGAGGVERELRLLCSEAPGAVVEIDAAAYTKVLDLAQAAGLQQAPQLIGHPRRQPRLRVLRDNRALIDVAVTELEESWRWWGQEIRRLRDRAGPETQTPLRGGLHATPTRPVRRPAPSARRPAALVLREQGSNGHLEMAAALDAAGFAVRIAAGAAGVPARHWRDSQLLALPGGFTYGDALGAGWGWAQTLARDASMRDGVRELLARKRLVLGVCNGCQALSVLLGLLDSGARLPRFLPNRSGRFEGRLAQIEVLPSPSPFLAPLVGARLPVPLACGEGRAAVDPGCDAIAAMRLLDADGLPARAYPADPLGGDGAACGFVSADGLVTALMPHPERAWRTAQLPWRPQRWRRPTTPWLDCFIAARNHCQRS